MPFEDDMRKPPSKKEQKREASDYKKRGVTAPKRIAMVPGKKKK